MRPELSSGKRWLWRMPQSDSALQALESPPLSPCDAYALVGGLANSDELVRRLREHSTQPISRLARWIVAREVLHFRWHCESYFPLFQFRLSDMSLRPEVCDVMAELSGAFDDAAMARWFAQPNAFLADRMPAAVLLDEPTAVAAAARADRFVILG
jgi:hypothetical protein